MEPLIVPGTMDSLKAIASYAIAVAALAGLDKKAAYKLRLAVDEIVTNIISYGYETECQGTITLQAEIDEQYLKIAIEDSGYPFDPTQTLTPDNLDTPEQQQIGGWGIFLAKDCVDRLVYQRVGNKNRNVLILKRKNYEK